MSTRRRYETYDDAQIDRLFNPAPQDTSGPSYKDLLCYDSEVEQVPVVAPEWHVFGLGMLIGLLYSVIGQGIWWLAGGLS